MEFHSFGHCFLLIVVQFRSLGYIHMSDVHAYDLAYVFDLFWNHFLLELDTFFGAADGDLVLFN